MMEKLKCQKCGKEWISRVEKPIQCPRCKSINWDEEKNSQNISNISNSQEEKQNE